MTKFEIFAQAVNARFNELASKYKLFTTTQNDHLLKRKKGATLKLTYLAAFPEGTNKVFRVNAEHDCSCCKSFIKNIGGLVAFDEKGVKLTVWDGMENMPAPYAEVAESLRNLVLASAVETAFFTDKDRFGQQISEELTGEGGTIDWHHFWADVPAKYVVTDKGSKRSAFDGNAAVFEKGLAELKSSAVDKVLEWVEQGVLYRGEDYESMLKGFKSLQAADPKLGTKAYVLNNCDVHGARIANTAIGKLLKDLSEGMDDEKALRSYETVTAPGNYKRPTAAITPAMVEAATQKVKELGYENSLPRRHMSLTDLNAANLLWADPDRKVVLQKTALEQLAAEVKGRAPTKLVEGAVAAKEFLESILPKAESVEVLFNNAQTGNLLTLTTQKYDSPGMFKWDSPVAWSYAGDVTDSIKERVKAAGGNVTGKLRVSLAWDNADDLDLEVKDSRGGLLYFNNRRAFGAFLDVDANGMDGLRKDPVENVAWTDKPLPGEYHVYVNQYYKRSKSDTGFTVEFETEGKITHITHKKDLARGNIHVAKLEVDSNGKVTVKPTDNEDLEVAGASKDVWGVTTETFVPVNAVLYSPNFWGDNAVGNKHVIFLMEGCKNPDTVRGIFNEYLKPELTEHRKVLEVLGSKVKVDYDEVQLSGLGFSQGRQDVLTVKVKSDGATRTYNVQF